MTFDADSAYGYAASSVHGGYVAGSAVDHGKDTAISNAHQERATGSTPVVSTNL